MESVRISIKDHKHNRGKKFTLKFNFVYNILFLSISLYIFFRLNFISIVNTVNKINKKY